MKTAVRYGLIYGGVGVAISLLTFGLGIEKEDYIQTLSKVVNIVLPLIIIFLGIREKRDVEQNGFISFGSAFSCGMVISVVSAVVTGLYTYFYMALMNPSIATFIKMKQEEELYSRGMSDSEVAKISANMDMWISPGMVSLFAIVGILLLGLVISLIWGAILKKENPADIL